MPPVRGKGPKRAKSSGGDGVHTLLSALKKHKKFKQMCSFALDTLCKSIDPINSDWNNNVDDLVGHGGIEQLADILKLYPHDEDVFGYCSKILARVPKNYRHGKKYTKRLVESGAVRGILESMQNMADLRPESVDNAASLLLSAAERNAQSMADEEHISAILKCAARFSDSQHVQKACSRAVELICKNPAGREAFLKCGGTDSLLASFKYGGATDDSILSGLRCINRICLQVENIKSIDVDNTIGTVVDIIAQRNNEAVDSIGSRLLSRLTATTFDEVLQSLNKAGITAAERAHGFSLISNLAIDRLRAADIVENGGVKLAIDALSPESSVGLQISAATLLARMALNDGVVADIVANGGMEALVVALNKHADNPALVAATMEALGALLTNKEHLDRLVAQGGVSSVLAAIKSLAGDKSVALEGMRFCTRLVELDYSVGDLIKEGGIEAALNCIRAHPGDTQVLELAMALLSAMAETSPENAAKVAENGGVDIALENLQKYADNPVIVQAALSLLATLAQDESNVHQLKSRGAAEFIIDAMYANPENDAIQATAAQVLRTLVTEDMIVETLAALQAATKALLEKKSAVQSANCIKLLVTLQAYATCNTDFIVSKNGHQIVHKLFASVTTEKKLPKKGMLMYGVYRVLNELFARYRNGPALFDTLKSGLGKELAEIQKNSKNSTQTRYGVQFLRTLTGIKARHADLLDLKIVEAFSAALRDNSSPSSDGDNARLVLILDAGCRGLMELSTDEVGAKAVAQRGGTRQLLNVIDSAELYSSEVDGVLLLSLKVLELICREASGRTIVNKQDGGTAVVACLRAKGTHEEISRSCLNLLSKLFDEEMVKKLVSQLVKLSESIGKHFTPGDLGNLSRLAGAIGYVARISEYSSIVVSEGGAAALVRSLIAVSALPPSDHQEACVDTVLDSLGQLGNTVPASAYSEAVPIILYHLQQSSSFATLVCVQRLARDSSNIPAIISDNADWSESTAGDRKVWKNASTGETRNVPHPTASSLESVLARVQGTDTDASTVGAGFDLLSVLCDTPAGLDAVAATNALDIASEWLQYNLDDSSGGQDASDEQNAAVIAALELVAKLSKIPENARELEKSGLFELVSDAALAAAEAGNDALLAAAINLFTSACTDPDVCASMVAKGLVSNLVSMFNKHPGCKKGKLAPSSMLELLSKVAGHGHKDNLRDAKADDFIMSLMGINPDSAELMALGANILGELLTPQDLLHRAIVKVKELIKQVKGGQTSAKVFGAVKSELSGLMSLIYVDGAVTKATGKELLDLAVEILNVMHPHDSADAENIKATAMQIIGKLAELDVGLSVHHCIPSIVAAATAVKSTDKEYSLTPLHAAGLGALKLLLDARDPELVMGLLKAGALRHLEKAHGLAVSSGNLKAAEEVANVVKRLVGQMLDNYDALVAAGFESTLLNAIGVLGAIDPQGMVGALQFIKGRAQGDGDELLTKLMNLNAMVHCPDGWKHLKTKDGKDYYVDSDGKAHWTPPLGFVGEVDAQRARKFQNQVIDYIASLALHDPQSLTELQMQLLLHALEVRSDGAELDPEDHAIAIAMNALVKLVANNPAFSKMMVSSEKVAELLNRLVADEDDEELSMHAMETFQALAADAALEDLSHFVEHDTVKVLIEKIRKHEDHQLIVAQALTALHEFGVLLHAEGLKQSGFDEAAYVLVGNVFDKYEQENEVIRTDGAAILDMMQPLYPNVSRGAGQVSSDLIKCKDLIGAGSSHVAVPYKDGRMYYVNSETKESTWDEPESYRAMVEHFERQAEHIRAYKGKGEEVDPEVIKACIDALKKHSHDPKFVACIAETLNYLADNEANLRQIAEKMGIEVVIKNLKKHPENDALLKMFLAMLAKFAHHDVFKQRIGRVGGVEVIILALRAQLKPEKVAMDLPEGWTQSVDKKGRVFYANKSLKKTQWQHPLTTNWREAVDPKGRTYYFNKKTKETSWSLPAEVQEIKELAQKPSAHCTMVKEILTMLSKLTFNSEQNTNLAVKHDGVGAMKGCMNVLHHRIRIMEVALTNLSNWMFISDSIKEVVREQCGSEILKAIKQHHSDEALFKMSLRAVGNMSLLDSNVAWLTEQHAIKTITTHLNTDKNSDDTKETAIKVIGNFAKSSEDIKEEIQSEDDLTVTQVIFNDGGAHAILDCISADNEENTSLLLTAIEALNDIAQDVDTAEKLLDKGLVPLVVTTMQRYDYDEEIIEPTVELISTLCYSKEAMEIFTDMQGVQLLLTAMDTHEQNVDLLINGQIALHVIASSREHRETIQEAGGIDTILRLMRKHLTEHEFMVEALGCLGQLAGNKTICTYIAEHGMHTLMQVVNANLDNADMLDKVLKVLGFLAFQEQGVQKIVQHDGINVIMSSIARHAHQEKLMVRAIKTLDFIAMAHPDFGAIVNAHGGAAVIRKIMSAYSHVQDIQDSGKSALLFLDDPSAQAS